MNALERRYRWLLRAYPAGYRARRGDEIVATLLDNAHADQKIPSLADVADIVWHAARTRLGGQAAGELETALRMAAPWALAMAAGLAGYLWWQAEPATPTTGRLAYLAWLIAAAAVVLPDTWVRRLTGGAILATLATIPLAAVTDLQRPPLWVVAALCGFGCVALAGHSPVAPEARFNVAAAAIAVAVVCGLAGARVDGYYQPAIASTIAVIALAALATAIVAIRRYRLGRPARPALLAGLLIALPAAWLGPAGASPWLLHVDSHAGARFGRLAHIIIVTCAVVMLIIWCLNRKWLISTRRESGVVLGSATGYGAFTLLVGWHALAGIAMAVLAVVAALLHARPSMRSLVASAAVAFGASWLVAFYGGRWPAELRTDPTQTVALAAILTALPCLAVLCLRPASFLARVVALAWIGYLALPTIIAASPLLWAITAVVLTTVALDFIQQRRHTRGGNGHRCATNREAHAVR